MARVLVGHEEVQVRDGQNLLTGFIEVDEDGSLKFAQTSEEEVSTAEAVKGTFGDFEEVAEEKPEG